MRLLMLLRQETTLTTRQLAGRVVICQHRPETRSRRWRPPAEVCLPNCTTVKSRRCGQQQGTRSPRKERPHSRRRRKQVKQPFGTSRELGRRCKINCRPFRNGTASVGVSFYRFVSTLRYVGSADDAVVIRKFCDCVPRKRDTQ